MCICEAQRTDDIDSDPTCTKVPEELPPWWKYKYFEITDTSVHSIPYQIYQYVKC
jgi:hypothetical protein